MRCCAIPDPDAERERGTTRKSITRDGRVVLIACRFDFQNRPPELRPPFAVRALFHLRVCAPCIFSTRTIVFWRAGILYSHTAIIKAPSIFRARTFLDPKFCAPHGLANANFAQKSLRATDRNHQPRKIFFKKISPNRRANSSEAIALEPCVHQGLRAMRSFQFAQKISRDHKMLCRACVESS